MLWRPGFHRSTYTKPEDDIEAPYFRNFALWTRPFFPWTNRNSSAAPARLRRKPLVSAPFPHPTIPALCSCTGSVVRGTEFASVSGSVTFGVVAFVRSVAAFVDPCHSGRANRTQRRCRSIFGRVDPEDGSAFSINAGYLTIKDSVVDLQVFGDPGREFRKTVEGVSISRNQFALAGRNVRQCPETIDLQFKKKVVGIEWFVTP
jgi:hypothetical protein